MPTVTSNTIVTQSSQFGSTPSQASGAFKLFGVETGLADLVDLASFVKPVPWLYYEPNYNQKYGLSDNFVHLDSPNLSVPGYATYDLQGFAGFEVSAGLYATYSYDFGNLRAAVTVRGERPVVSQVVNGPYVLDTASTTIDIALSSIAATQPFSFDIVLGGGDGLDGYLRAGVKQLGVYEDDDPYKTTDALFFNKEWHAISLLDPPVLTPGAAPYTFGSDKITGFVGAPTLPALDLHLSATGGAAIGASAQYAGKGTPFAGLAIDPVAFIPVIGELNRGTITVVDNWLIAAGADYRVLGLDVTLDAALKQDITVSIQSVKVTARAQEDVSEDSDFDDYNAANGGDSRAQGAAYSNGFVTVSEVTGSLGDKLFLGNFTAGSDAGKREHTRVIEEYDVTLRVDTTIDIALTGGVRMSFLEFSAFINPILLDEIRVNIGPLFPFNEGGLDFALELASIEVFSDHFLIDFDNAAVMTHEITTYIAQTGTEAGEKIVLGKADVNIDAKGGADAVYGNGVANVIEGGSGNDAPLAGRDGDDSINGGSGWDLIVGNNGDDRLDTGTKGAGNDTEIAKGGAGNDVIVNHGQAVSLSGEAGDDILQTDVRIVFTSQPDGFGGTIVSRSLPVQTVSGSDGIDLLRVNASTVDRPFTVDFGSLGTSNTIEIDDTFTPNALKYETIERFDFTSGTVADRLYGNALGDILNGGGGDDLLRGRAGDDALDGSEGTDRLFGEGGDDALFGGTGDDIVYGGSDDDSLYGNAGADRLYGEDGEDLLIGNGGNDYLDGGAGTSRDFLYGIDGDDTLIGGAGADDLAGGAGDDVLTGGAGANTLRGEEGDDRITIGTGAGTVATGGNGFDTFIVGSQAGKATIDGGGPGGVDTLIVASVVTASKVAGTPVFYEAPANISGMMMLKSSGTLGNGTTYAGIEVFDFVFGSTDDRIVAGVGNDRLRGGAGNDVLDGGAGGIDTLDGGSGNDQLIGRTDDIFYGGTGTDILYLNAHDDTKGFTFAIGAMPDPDPTKPTRGSTTPIGASNGNLGGSITGIERLVMYSDGGTGADRISGGALADSLIGGAGNDVLDGGADGDYLTAGTGHDIARGGEGNDVIDARDTTIYSGTFRPPAGDRLFGEAGNDLIQASNTARLVDGGTGADTITISDGGSLGDIAPADILGGGGADVISGSSRAERIIGGLDPIDRPQDLIDPAEPDSAVPDMAGYQVDLADQIHAGGGDDLVRGGAGNDKLYGDAGADTVEGGSGNDTIDGGLGNDKLYGGSGDDTIVSGSGVDLLDGGIGNDTLTGSYNSDRLVGGDGDDVLNGGQPRNGSAGVDLLIGGDGVDRLTVMSAATLDGGWGKDIYALGTGVQTVIERFEDGRDTELNRVTGFTSGQDRIRIDGLGLTPDRLVYTDTSEGVTIGLTGVEGTAMILLVGITRAGLAADSVYVTGPAHAKADAIALSSGTTYNLAASAFLANDTGDAVSIASVSGASGVGAAYQNGIVRVVAGITDGQFTYKATNSGGTDSAVVSVDVLVTTENADSVAAGSALFAVIDGKGGDDAITGSIGTDRLTGGTGNDRIDGGAGTDAAYFSGVKADYTWTTRSGTTFIRDTSVADGDDGIDTLTGIERLVFKDGDISLGATTNARMTTVEPMHRTWATLGRGVPNFAWLPTSEVFGDDQDFGPVIAVVRSHDPLLSTHLMLV